MAVSFVKRVLRLFAEYDLYDQLFWTERLEMGVRCSDFFFWGTADVQLLAKESLGQLQQAIADCGNVIENGEEFGPLLFAARERRMRPQGAAYDTLPRELWPLFDACGPKRVTDVMNPYAPGERSN